MKSPNFSLRSKELQQVVTVEELKRVWRRTIRVAMRRQFLQDPIEFFDFHRNIDSQMRQVCSAVLGGTYHVHPPKRILVEKSRGLCRQIVIPHPRDCVLLQCLSDNLFFALNKERPHENAFFEPERNVFSLAAGKTGGYGSKRSWLQFQKEILSFQKERDFIVVTDIANYYDFISYSQLRNFLSGRLASKESHLDLLIYCLSSMLWQPDYMPRIETGLPQIDIDAPRLLAHAFLFGIDEFIASKPVDYARFMDDIDVGVDTIADAKAILRDIDLILQARQIRLNSGKTKILTKAEAARHFVVRENELVSALDDRIKQRGAAYLPIARRMLRFLTKRWQSARAFDAGNGEKILKRLINLSAKTNAFIRGYHMRSFLFTRPGIRETALRYVSRVSHGENYLDLLLEVLKSPTVVDDAVALHFSDAVVEMRASQPLLRHTELIDACDWMLSHEGNGCWVYASLWTLSKYGNQEQVLDAVRKSIPIWRSDYFLGRLVGGLLPVLPATEFRIPFRRIMRSVANAGATEVLEFYDQIQADSAAFNSIKPFVEATNKTLPNKITHAKWLVLKEVLWSSPIPKQAKNHLVSLHQGALGDHYYKSSIA